MGAEPRDRRKLVATWVKQAKLDGPDGVWSALAVPGITVTGAETACETLLLLADNMVGGGAHHLAYATVTNVRIAMLDSGPAGLRAQSAVRQAEILQAMGMPDEATDTFECAIEDAIRGRDSETEARARRGMQAVRDAAG
jgi:hypothetical protein